MEALRAITNAIITFLDKNSTCTEHELISELTKNKVPPFDQLNIQLSKDLFSAHFLTMHALYHLQNNYFNAQQYYLKIESIKIQRLNYSGNKEGLLEHDPLKDYYLNISHYFETSEEDINQLLNSFWTKFLAQDDKQQALKTLDLPLDTTAANIKKKYRLLAQQHHPDKSGCSKHFIKITAAKNILNQFY